MRDSSDPKHEEQPVMVFDFGFRFFGFYDDVSMMMFLLMLMF